jgi:hypothetical protein
MYGNDYTPVVAGLSSTPAGRWQGLQAIDGKGQNERKHEAKTGH